LDVRKAVLLAPIIAVAAATGLVAAYTSAVLVIASVGATCALGWLIGRFGAGFLAGLLTLGAVDALPGPDLENAHLANSITGQDVFVIALMILLLRENRRSGDAGAQSRLARVLLCGALAFLLYYASVVVRTWVTTPVPLLHAVTYSRDMPYFAILLPLFLVPLRDERFRRIILITLGAGVVVASLAQAAAVGASIPLAFLVHGNSTAVTSGLSRLSTSAVVLPFAGVPFGLGLLLFETSRLRRAGGALIAATSTAALLLSLTRAMYIGEVAGLTVSVGWVFLEFGAGARMARGRFVRAAAVLAAGTAAIVIVAPSVTATPAVSGVVQRTSSLVADLSGGASDPSLVTRQVETTGIQAVIGSHWAFGVGFLDPTYDYRSFAVDGSIRNIDVPLISAVAVIGLVGVALYAVPLFLILVALLRSRLVEPAHRGEWISFAAVAWCVGVIVTSQTLGFLFTPAETPAAAFILALAATYLYSTPDRLVHPQPSVDPQRSAEWERLAHRPWQPRVPL
jgi:hypothetical protein